MLPVHVCLACVLFLPLIVLFYFENAYIISIGVGGRLLEVGSCRIWKPPEDHHLSKQDVGPQASDRQQVGYR